jgi:hypothetical protein
MHPESLRRAIQRRLQWGARCSQCSFAKLALSFDSTLCVCPLPRETADFLLEFPLTKEGREKPHTCVQTRVQFFEHLPIPLKP